MTKKTYVNVHVHHVRRGEWLAYIPLLDLSVSETSEPKAEYAAYAKVEEALGLKNFSLIWTKC